MAHEYLQILKDFGPILGVILFFIWRDWKREDRLLLKIEKLEEFQQTQLLKLLEETNTVVAHNTDQLKWVQGLVQQCHSKDRS